MSGVVEMSFKFLGDTIGTNMSGSVVGAEVDNIAGIVRLLIRERDDRSESPQKLWQCRQLEDAFVVLRYPGQPIALVHNRARWS